MSEGSEPGPPPVYGGRRRTRGLLSRLPDHQSVDDAHPTVPDAVRYFPKTGQIAVVGDASTPQCPQPEPQLGVGKGAGFRLSGADSAGSSDDGATSAGGRSLVPEETSPREAPGRRAHRAEDPVAGANPAPRPASSAAPPTRPPSGAPARITIDGAQLARSSGTGPIPATTSSRSGATGRPDADATGSRGAPRASTDDAPRAVTDDRWRVPATGSIPLPSAAMIAPLHDAPARGDLGALEHTMTGPVRTIPAQSPGTPGTPATAGAAGTAGTAGTATLVAPPRTETERSGPRTEHIETLRPGRADAPEPARASAPVDETRAPGVVRRIATAPATWLGIAAVAICLVAANIPAFSLHEAVTIEAARRDWDGMWTLIESGHAANAVWMWITHLWIGAFGASELSLRILPAIAAGATVVGITHLATRLSGPRVGLFTGIIAALLPRIALQGGEASAIAFGMALATWATVALVRAVSVVDPIPHFDVPKQLISHRNRARRRQAIWRHIGRWSVVALLLALGAWVHVPVVLMALAHPVFIMAAGARRGALRGSSLASLSAVVLASPLLVAVALQDWWLLGRASELPTGPWAWITEPSMTDALVAVPVSIMAAIVLGVAIARIRRLVARAGTTSLTLAITWIVVPTAAFGLLQLFAPHTYAADYLAFTAPAVAMLLGIALTAGPTWLWITLLVLMLQALLPPLLFQKLPTGRDGSDDRATAQYIGASAAEGDGIVFSDWQADGGKSSRVMLSTYPAPFAGLVDLTLAQTGEAAGTLWDTSVDIATVPNRLDDIDRVWVLRPADEPMTSKTPEFAIYADEGFAVMSSAVFTEFIVYELVRTDAYGLDADGNPPAPDPLPPLPSPVPTAYDDVEE